jgi:catechol 2,3-dioxygenase-like lactoylglutathione lyase family enzyme
MNLNQITLPVLDIPKAIVFYELLGLELIVPTHEAYARLELADADATLSLYVVKNCPNELKSTSF